MNKRIIPVVRQRDIKNIIKRVQPPIPRIGKVLEPPRELQNSRLFVKQLPQTRILVNNNHKPINKPLVSNKTIRQVNRSQQNPITRDADYNRLMSLKNSGTGQILVMIACGPSANEVDFSPLKNGKNIRTMVINKPISYIWPTDYWAFCDQSQYERNKLEFESYNGLLINSIGVRARRSNQILIKAIQGQGFNIDITNGYYIGRSSVYANMQTALFMNFDKIFIFGIDMCAVNGKTHHYGNGFNPDVDTEIRIQRFTYEANHYNHAATILSEEMRKKFYFCSSYNPFSFVEKFNKWDHKDAIQKILDLSK
jgi:hypothetical protein